MMLCPFGKTSFIPRSHNKLNFLVYYYSECILSFLSLTHDLCNKSSPKAFSTAFLFLEAQLILTLPAKCAYCHLKKFDRDEVFLLFKSK